MKLKSLICKLCKQLTTSINNKIEAMNQKEAERQQQIAEQNRKNIEDIKGTALRKRWAFALNALPVHLQVVSHAIDSYALSNKYEKFVWTLQISLAESLTISKCNILKKHLQEILTNQFLECRQEFQEKICSDSNEYAEQLSLVTNGRARTKEDSAFRLSYNQFCNINYYRLVNIKIISIACAEKELHIQYTIDESACLYFHSNNYWQLINS